jgi:hypothetical protein
MNSNCVEVDELILQLADYKNDYARGGRKAATQVLAFLGSVPVSGEP